MRAMRVMGLVGLWLVVVLTVPIGLIAATAAMLATAGVSGSRVLAAIVALVAAVVCTGGLSWVVAARATGRLPLRRGVPSVVTGLTLVVLGILLWVIVFAPAPKYVAEPCGGYSYWNLPTGSRIAYTFSPGQGTRRPTPVILVHGGPGAPYTEEHDSTVTATLTRAGFDVYHYDQVGAGCSGRLQDINQYTVARHVADLEAIRAAIGAKQVDLVGVSWGGQLIANYLAAHPDRVGRATVASPGPIWEPAYPDNANLTAGGARDQSTVLARHPRFTVANLLLSAAGPQSTYTLFPDGQVDTEYQAFVGGLDLRAGCQNPHPPGLRPTGNGEARYGFWVNAMTTRSAQRVADPRPALRKVSTPVLVMRGQCDQLAWNVTREYRDVLPNALLITIPEAGHEIPTDQPTLYDTSVRDFLLNEPLPRPSYAAETPPRF